MLKLEIKGLGHVPGKKNRFYAGKNGRILIDKETAQKVERITRSLELQLLSKWRTISEGTEATCTQQSLTALLTQSAEFDDRWSHLPEENIRCIKCEPGEEGAEIEVIKL